MTVFIQPGDAPMDARQAIKRGLRHFEAEKAGYVREQGMVEGDPAYLAWAQQWIEDNQVNAANNLFNHALAAYRAAVARLALYRLADGRAEVVGDDGEVLVPAVEPLPATVEVIGDDGNTETVPNPVIVADDVERAAAQAVIDATPAPVAAFDGGA